VLGQSKQRTGSFATGFAAYAVFALLVLIVLRVVAKKWTRTWVGAGGRALSVATEEGEQVATGSGLLIAS